LKGEEPLLKLPGKPVGINGYGRMLY